MLKDVVWFWVGAEKEIMMGGLTNRLGGNFGLVGSLGHHPGSSIRRSAATWGPQPQSAEAADGQNSAFDQVVEPLITEITCLRSHELRLFHLVSAYIGSPLGGTTD